MKTIFSREANQSGAPFQLMSLPFSKTSLDPIMSEETLDFHHGKHHATYVKKLNALIEADSELKGKTLEEVVIISSKQLSHKPIFDNAAQVWNHNFFWHCLGGDKHKPTGPLLEQINEDFGDYDSFLEEFKKEAAGFFGSGWIWLVFADNRLEIVTTANADLPILANKLPILVCDLWEHAHYIDYRNDKGEYLSKVLDNAINWEFAEKNFQHSS